MKLTAQNYYSKEADQAYWSASQVKAFLSCPARVLAELRGEYQRPPSNALLIGGFVDAAFEGTATEFCEEHPELFKRDGSLKAEFAKAAEMVERAEQDELFMDYMAGEKQRIFTGELFGLPFKAKFDVYKPGERIVDLKTVKDMQPMYAPGQGKVSFAEYWNWPLQLAIYQALEGNHLPCYLAVITKEAVPDIAVIQVPQSYLDIEMKQLEDKLQYFDAIKQGIIEPERCESCDYCKRTKVLTQIQSLDDYSTF